MHCAAAIQAERGFPDRSSPEADEGTAMHEVRARALKTGRDVMDFEGWLWWGGSDVRRPTLATRKNMLFLLEGVERIYDLCGDIQALREKEPRYVLVEENLKFEDRALADVYGTLDFGAFLFELELAVIDDLKFGAGEPVYPEWHEQQLIYGGLALDSLTRNERRRLKRLKIVIDQPRIADAGGEWDISIYDLEKWIAEKLHPAVEATKVRNPAFNPGVKQCRWCLAKRGCQAYQDFCIETAGITFDDERDGKNFATDGIAFMSPERRSHLLKHKKMLEDFLEDVFGYSLAEAQAGRPTPGYKAALGKRGARAWVSKEAALDALLPILGEKAQTTEVVSPAALDDLLPAAEIKKLGHLWKQADAKPTLVPETSKKAEIPQIEMKDER